MEVAFQQVRTQDRRGVNDLQRETWRSSSSSAIDPTPTAQRNYEKEGWAAGVTGREENKDNTLFSARGKFTGWLIWSVNWFDWLLIGYSSRLALLLGPFCLNLIIPRQIWKTMEMPKSKHNPVAHLVNQPVNLLQFMSLSRFSSWR